MSRDNYPYTKRKIHLFPAINNQNKPLFAINLLLASELEIESADELEDIISNSSE